MAGFTSKWLGIRLSQRLLKPLCDCETENTAMLTAALTNLSPGVLNSDLRKLAVNMGKHQSRVLSDASISYQFHSHVCTSSLLATPLSLLVHRGHTLVPMCMTSPLPSSNARACSLPLIRPLASISPCPSPTAASSVCATVSPAISCRTKDFAADAQWRTPFGSSRTKTQPTLCHG